MDKLTDKSMEKENRKLSAQLKQIKRSSCILTSTPKRTKQVSQKEYEVKNLLNHRRRKPNREFLVSWKGFNDSVDDTWEHESNLNCPAILSEYLKKHRLAE